MSIETTMAATVAAVLAAALTGAVRKLALRHGVMDLPNARSSHVSPTPRGGGIAIVLSVTLALGVLVLTGRIDSKVFAALAGGGGAVAAIGFVDDRRPLSARVRLVVHVIAALWALVLLGGLPPLLFGKHLVSFGWVGYPLGALGIVWVLNLFNFMDGIDGIAASEAGFIAWGGALVGVATGLSEGVAASAIVFGAACCGFLLWNWPPAKIFMGDVGSGYLGYFIAVLALAAGSYGPTELMVWLILGGVFFVDATVTFIRRLIRREPVHLAHRSHAYQRLARRWRSHKRVTIAVMLVNILWLLPSAYLASLLPSFAAWIVAGALMPVVVVIVAAGAGRPES